jgi:hypothetical protein
MKIIRVHKLRPLEQRIYPLLEKFTLISNIHMNTLIMYRSGTVFFYQNKDKEIIRYDENQGENLECHKWLLVDSGPDWLDGRSCLLFEGAEK